MYIEPLKVFRDLAETGSFSKAAEMHGISQSAVSQQVRAVEKHFACTLVERGHRVASLTPEGVAFLKTAKAILAIWDDFAAAVSTLKNEISGELRIASIYSIGLHELPQRLKKFREAYPLIDAKVEYRRSPQVYDLVERGEADIGLVAYPARRAGLIAEVFDEDELVFICHPKHRLAKRAEIKLPDLKGERFIAFGPDAPTRKIIDQQLRKAGLGSIQAIDFDNIETVKRAVEIESGVSIVPKNTVAPEVKGGQLAAIPLQSPKMSRPLGFILSRTRPRPPGLREFIAVLKVRA